MTQSNITSQDNQKIHVEGPLNQLIRQGVMRLIASAVEAELDDFLEQHTHVLTTDGVKAIVRNGYLPKRTLFTSIGHIEIQVPRVRDRSDLGIHFSSVLVPPYLKRVQDQQELLPWLYLKGFVSGDFQEVLAALLGISLDKISPTILARLQKQWLHEHDAWHQRSLQHTRYLYWRADSFHGSIADEELDLRIIAGITEDGRQDLVAITAVAASPEAGWLEPLHDLQRRGLAAGPKFADGDHADGFWLAMAEVFPDTTSAVHKPSNAPEAIVSPFQTAPHTDNNRVFSPAR
ncbi:MAG: transposase [Pseudomonadota bacterium]